MFLSILQQPPTSRLYYPYNGESILNKRPFLFYASITLVIASFLVCTERFFHSLTDHFGYPSITSNLCYHKEWEITIDEHDWTETKKALDQPYTYLGSGSQSYVFLSEDKKYILKFFKHKRWTLNPLIEFLPLPHSLNAKRNQWKQKKKETVESTFRSCLTAYQEFKEETGVFFIHLNKTTFDQSVTLKDFLGFKHQINLGSVAFVLQKKAIPTDTYLLSLKKEGKIEEAQKALASLLAFTVKRAHKGYCDKDPHLIRNFGFIGGKAVEIDIGGFYHDPKKDLHYFYTHEMEEIEKKLLPWMQKNYAELTPYAKKALAEITHVENQT